MAHKEQQAFCKWVRNEFPRYFEGPIRVLDCGSLDINGNNRFLFDADCEYIGIDIHRGPNVDCVGRIHDMQVAEDGVPQTWGSCWKPFDFVISTEMLEHDEFYQASLRAMVRLLKPGGMLLFTCATIGRPEHGTARTTPTDSPSTLDYYRNLEAADIAAIPGFLTTFSTYQFFVEDNHKDLCFYGIKKRG